MNKHYWRIEIWRLILVLLVAISAGILSHYWLLSLILVLSCYIVYLLLKLQQLHQWLQQGAKPKQTPDNFGLWLGITEQILSIQKQSNKRKKQLTKFLKSSRRIITGLPYATIVLNDNNEIDWANKISAIYFNIDIKKDRGQRIDKLIRFPDFVQALANNSEQEIIVALPPKGGRTLALQLITVDKQQKLLVAQDVTERENILQMRKNFIANASHELRTPLTVIAGYLEIMRADTQLPEDLKTAVNAASSQSIRMQRIIDDLLTLSRLENSALDDQLCSDIDMSSLLQEIINNEKYLLSNNSHILHAEIDQNLNIIGAETEIISACNNLIHNAIRHTQHGTVITIKWYQHFSGSACLSIKDNGQGISAEHIKHLTERFYRVDKGRSRDQGGTGLGLAIVQHIILRHGGHLDITSAINKGSTFTLSFPLSRVFT